MVNPESLRNFMGLIWWECKRNIMKFARSPELDRIWKFFGPLFLVLFGADQISKWWAVKNLDSINDQNIGMALSYNDGIVFGLNLPIWMIWVLTIAVFGLGVWLVIENKLWRDHWHLTGLALLLAGAIGNTIDRFRLGYVVDFLKVYWWPTFNLADVFIVSAVALFAWEFLIRENAFEDL